MSPISASASGRPNQRQQDRLWKQGQNVREKKRRERPVGEKIVWETLFCLPAPQTDQGGRLAGAGWTWESPKHVNNLFEGTGAGCVSVPWEA